MIRLVIPFVVLLALACGGESNPVGDAAEGAVDVAAPAISDEESAAIAIEDAEEADKTAEMKTVIQDEGIAQSCLLLVAEENFEDAVPVCTEALGLEPANTEIQQALDQAETELAKAALDDPAAAAGTMLK